MNWALENVHIAKLDLRKTDHILKGEKRRQRKDPIAFAALVLASLALGFGPQTVPVIIGFIVALFLSVIMGIKVLFINDTYLDVREAELDKMTAESRLEKAQAQYTEELMKGK